MKCLSFSLSFDKMSSNVRVNSLVNENLVKEYKENGAVCIRQMLNEDQIDLIRKGIHWNLSNPSALFKVASQDDDPGKFIEDFCTWESNQFYRKFIVDSPCAEVAARLMQSSISRFYHDHLLIKESNTQQITPWHQDQPYYDIEGNQTCSFWIPIDPITRYSTLEFIKGSHRNDKWFMPRTFMTSQAKWFPSGTLDDIPPIDDHRDQYPIIGWELKPGDVVAFHMLTLHGSRGTTINDGRRRVFSLRFLGDDIRHAPRTWITSPDLSHLTKDIPPGHPMDHPSFPILWNNNNI